MGDLSHNLAFWSAFTFWFVVINALVGLGFVIVVAIGGFFDLRYLLKAMREEPRDLTDDGRVQTPPETSSAQPAGPDALQAESLYASKAVDEASS